MNKMKSLSYLALTLMLTGVLSACGSNEAASPVPDAEQSSQSDGEVTNNEEETIADDTAEPAEEPDAAAEDTEAAEDSPAADSTPADNSGTSGTTDSSSSDTKESGKTDTAPADSGKTETPAASTGGTSGTDSKDTGKTDTAPAETPKDGALNGQGEYSGLADSHTVEIEVDGKAVSYQLSEAAQDQISTIPSQAMVKYTYTEDKIDDQTTVLTITEITTLDGGQ
ncbi:hypothetical protein QWJ34_01650 [Saccharibacillus sp. CPCC 101409]|uniref:hypothetical protein n=1 Tax=Saccharibacillus sp. CPCC 101409 TaxID=3058041 RepID=UPI0026735C72|nr:hypothetical protein [Saccharibacillus sp. CPCC 101409]MDO3408464.1 hypothetical protein [Saccharibacillus sp. CPCC 101409]